MFFSFKWDSKHHVQGYKFDIFTRSSHGKIYATSVAMAQIERFRNKAVGQAKDSHRTMGQATDHTSPVEQLPSHYLSKAAKENGNGDQNLSWPICDLKIHLIFEPDKWKKTTDAWDQLWYTQPFQPATVLACFHASPDDGPHGKVTPCFRSTWSMGQSDLEFEHWQLTHVGQGMYENIFSRHCDKTKTKKTCMRIAGRNHQHPHPWMIPHWGACR